MKQRDCGKLAAASALYHFAPNCSVDIKSSLRCQEALVGHLIIPVVYIPSMNKQ
ncbi:hypothetical protein T05_8438 [Trichinella murrelli]|uniref:Uncharacterized protein n=1 Tax=Trichinella murrelli TaxID=144512 RepID=A0A0V0T052_9BILA|nr:hypothetical protein T05_8438 [Trichinella murrelli]